MRAVGAAHWALHLYVRGKPAKGFEVRLRAIAREIGAWDRLHFLPIAPPPEMERLAGDYDLGFVGETGHTPNRRIALTNKQFTYLLAGVQAIMSDLPAHQDFARRVGVTDAVQLYPVDDHRALATIIDEMLRPCRLSRREERCVRPGQSRFNWDIEKGRIQAIVGRVLA